MCLTAPLSLQAAACHRWPARLRLARRSSSLNVISSSAHRSEVLERTNATFRQQQLSRRATLGAAAALLSLLSLRSPAARADEEELPKAYQDTARRLVRVLQESITKDLSGAEEREVRKAAEPAQDLMRQVMGRWGSSAAVRGSASYAALTAAIGELGEYYRKAGARARMSEAAGNSILRHLAEAEEALPPEAENRSLLPF